MRAIIGYGNELRGEDAFGLDVIKEMQKLELKDTKLISASQLTPEITLELLDADEIIFIDASLDEQHHYALACSTREQNSMNLSHHISPKTIIYMLNSLYEKYPKFYIYSMMSNSFYEITDNEKYNNSIEAVINHIACAIQGK